MSNKNEVFEYLIGQLRQQVNNNPYKQQCEDLSHEVQSLKNQLRDASAQIKELHKALAKATGGVEVYKLIRKGEYVSAGQRYVVGEHPPEASVNCRCTPTPIPPEQSGCRKEDVQECEHSWIIMPGLFLSEGNPNNVPGSELCSKCGKREWGNKEYKPKNDTQGCEHEWVEFHGLFIAEGDPRNEPGYTFCRKCGLKGYSRKCEHEWSYVMGDGPGFYECDVCGARSETLPYDLRWLA